MGQSTIGAIFAMQRKKKKEDDEKKQLAQFVIIPVCADGRCFFTTVVSSLFTELTTAERSSFGLIKDHDVMLMERQQADTLRKCVVEFLKSEKETLSEMSIALPYLLDEKVGKQYESLDDRLLAMSLHDTYAGNLEMMATSFLLRTQLLIYAKVGNEFSLIAKVPTESFASNSICLLYQQDSQNAPGHFNLMIAKDDMSASSKSHKFCINETFTDVINVLQNACDPQENAVIFSDVFTLTPCVPALPGAFCHLPSDTSRDLSHLPSDTSTDQSQLPLELDTSTDQSHLPSESDTSS